MVLFGRLIHQLLLRIALDVIDIFETSFIFVLRGLYFVLLVLFQMTNKLLVSFSL